MQHKILLLSSAAFVCRMVPITQFFSIKLWVASGFQMRDRLDSLAARFRFSATTTANAFA